MDTSGDGMGALVHQLYEAVQNAPAVKGTHAVMQLGRPIGSVLPRWSTGQKASDDHGWLQRPGATGISKGAHE
jgi:hypothetical protein